MNKRGDAPEFRPTRRPLGEKMQARAGSVRTPQRPREQMSFILSREAGRLLAALAAPGADARPDPFDGEA